MALTQSMHSMAWARTPGVAFDGTNIWVVDTGLSQRFDDRAVLNGCTSTCGHVPPIIRLQLVDVSQNSGMSSHLAAPEIDDEAVHRIRESGFRHRVGDCFDLRFGEPHAPPAAGRVDPVGPSHCVHHLGPGSTKRCQLVMRMNRVVEQLGVEVPTVGRVRCECPIDRGPEIGEIPICPQSDVVVDEHRLDERTMSSVTADKVHRVCQRPVQVPAVALEVSAKRTAEWFEKVVEGR